MAKEIVWTRQKDNWTKDQRLFSLPERVLPLATMMTAALPASKKPQAAKNYLITSQETLRVIGAEQQWLTLLARAKQIYCFGAMTKDFLCSKLNLTNITQIEANDGGEFAKKLAQCLDPSEAHLYLSSSVPATDIAAILSQHGLNVKSYAVYETIARVDDVARRLKILADAKSYIICFASPSAVKGMVAGLSADELTKLADATMVAIGKTTAASITELGLGASTLCNTPDLKELARTAENLL